MTVHFNDVQSSYVHNMKSTKQTAQTSFNIHLKHPVSRCLSLFSQTPLFFLELYTVFSQEAMPNIFTDCTFH